MKLKGNIEIRGCQWNSHWKEKLRKEIFMEINSLEKLKNQEIIEN